MFGQNNKPQDDQLIPDQAIEGALAADASAEPAAPAPNVSMPWQHPGTPLDAPVADPIAATPVSDDSPVVAPITPAPVAGDLLEIKQQALAELAPLVDHLEQSPEEKFRTTMMMLQASDDQSLVHVAYEAALAIGDEKAKAQALLDVINEINYFTQQAASQQPAA
ncbi:MAG: hypothetical protein JWO41_114 [Candidatus Saccharibacteria bacterium]|nr:hypothetical protein [Candidatus Saccharibacteria bacterium]